jgi:hypothetical protein
VRYSAPLAAPSLGRAQIPLVLRTLSLNPSHRRSARNTSKAPSRGEGGRGPAALKRLDSGPRGGDIDVSFEPLADHYTPAVLQFLTEHSSSSCSHSLNFLTLNF